MTFSFKAYKQIEFDSVFSKMLFENQIHIPGIVVEYIPGEDNDDIITAKISDAIIEKLTAEQLSELRGIK